MQKQRKQRKQSPVSPEIDFPTLDSAEDYELLRFIQSADDSIFAPISSVHASDAPTPISSVHASASTTPTPISIQNRPYFNSRLFNTFDDWLKFMFYTYGARHKYSSRQRGWKLEPEARKFRTAEAYEQALRFWRDKANGVA